MTELQDTEPFTSDQLAYALDGVFVLTNAMHRTLLRHVVMFDRSEAWKEDGVHSVVDWLCFKYGYAVTTARQLVDVAHALHALPAIAQAFEDGRLTWDKVVDLCSFVPADEDERYAEDAQIHNAAQVKEWARHARRKRRKEAARAAHERSLRMYWDRDHELLHLSAVLPGAEGAAVKRAIERVAESYGPDEHGVWSPHEHREADALIELAGARLAEDTDLDRATVVVHVDARDLNAIHGTAVLEDGPVVCSEVARRLSCDGRIQVVADGPDGEPIGIGRRSRTIPPWLLRALKKRDAGCVMNGCGRTRGVQAHHVIHWAHGGRTDLDNLVLVCPRCHRKIHDEGFRLLRDHQGRLRTIRPDGRPVHPHRAALRPEHRARVFGRPPHRRPARRE